MPKKTEEAGADFVLGLIKTLDDGERAALDAIRRFVASVDKALPRAVKKNAPRRQAEVVEAALQMIEQFFDVSNEAARRVTESVRQTLPEIEANAKAAIKKPSPKKTAAKKTAAKKNAAKKTAAKKTAAKKTAAKKTAAKEKSAAKW